MKNIKSLFAVLAVVILTAATVAWAMPVNEYFVHNHTTRNLGTVTIEYLGSAPPQNINVSTTGNYLFYNSANLSAIVINGSRIYFGTNGTANAPITGTPLIVNSNSTGGWDIYEH